MPIFPAPSPCSRHDDLIPLVDILNYLENTRVTNGMPDIGKPAAGNSDAFRFAARFDQGASPFDRPQDPELTALVAKPGGNMSPELDDYAQKKGIGYWSCKLSFYGAAKANAANWEFAKEKFSAIPGAKFEDGESYKLPLTAEQREKVHKPQFGIPSLAMFSIGARSATNPTPDEWAHVVFADHSRGRARRSSKRIACFAQAAKELGLPFLNFNLPSTYWERAFIFIFAFSVTHDIETNKKNRASFKKLIQVAAEHGWGEYRTRAGVSGRDDEHLFVQQSRAAAFSRNGQGRHRSQRDSFRGPVRYLAEAYPGGQVMKKLEPVWSVAFAFFFAASALPAQEASRGVRVDDVHGRTAKAAARIRAVSKLLLDVPRRGRRKTGHAGAAGEI